jgi:hypothetical protein
MDVTPEIHDAVVAWLAARKEYLNMSLIAREAKVDASFCRKVLTGVATDKGTPYRLQDTAVAALYDIAVRLGEPIVLPKAKTKKKSHG